MRSKVMDRVAFQTGEHSSSIITHVYVITPHPNGNRSSQRLQAPDKVNDKEPESSTRKNTDELGRKERQKGKQIKVQ